ncbi:DUF488 family protein [bacterium]|nr:DUF488 family protein [bacterium]
MPVEIRAKRVYESPAEDDGFRVLVDRLWPRGVSKAAAKINLWAKVLTPSNELRRWFHSSEPPYEEFVARFEAELADRQKEIDELLPELAQPVITLVTATKNVDGGHVEPLKRFLETRLAKL